MTTDWKAAHDNLAARNALLRQRHDLPVDRIPAHAELVRLQEENARLRAQHAESGAPAADARQRFEGYAKAAPLPLDGHCGHYSNIRTRNQWLGWQAALAAQQAAADPVVEANRKLLLERSNVGIDKYGATLEDANLAAPALVQHALEEALDLSNYLQALLRKLS